MMRHQNVARSLVTGIGAAMVVAGCSSSSAGVPGTTAASPQQSAVLQMRGASRQYPSWMRFADPDSQKGGSGIFQPYVATMNTNENSGSFVTQYRNYDLKGKPICSLPGADSDYIGGIAVDGSGNLYVPQSVASYTQINVYGPQCGSQVNTLTSSVGNQPQDVAVYGNSVYLIDASYRHPAIEVFANGSTSPTGTLSDSSIYQDFYLAVDSNDDVFLSYYSQTGSTNVIEFPNGTTLGTVLPISGSGPDGILIDKSNNLLFIIPGQSSWEVSVYAPPYTGSPIETFDLKGSSPNQNGPEYCAFGQNYKRLDCGDSAYKSVDFYKYPSGTYLYSLLLPYSPYSLTYSLANDPAP